MTAVPPFFAADAALTLFGGAADRLRELSACVAGRVA